MRKKCSSSAVEEVVGSMDLLGEILIRLPLKPLVRSKCVSKQWLTLISNQRFRDSHYHKHKHQLYTTSLIFSLSNLYFRMFKCLPQHPHVLCLTAATPTHARLLNLDFLNQSKLTVVRSCNGILLCYSEYTAVYFICNPITKDFTTLTCFWHPSRATSKSIVLYLVSDVTPFKVISVAKQKSSPLDYVFNVYCFKTRSWINSKSLSTPFDLGSKRHGVYCNRAIHWCKEGEISLVYFDVDVQCLKICPMPLSSSSEWLDRSLHYFGESGGRLHLMLTSHRGYPNYDIFELKEDYSGWTLRHRVDLGFLDFEFGVLSCSSWYQLRFVIVRAAKNDNILVLIASKDAAFFLSYDPVDGTSTKLCDFDKMGSTTASDDLILNCTDHVVLQYFETDQNFLQF